MNNDPMNMENPDMKDVPFETAMNGCLKVIAAATEELTNMIYEGPSSIMGCDIKKQSKMYTNGIRTLGLVIECASATAERLSRIKK